MFLVWFQASYVIQRELASQHRGWRTPSGGSPDTTLALSREAPPEPELQVEIAKGKLKTGKEFAAARATKLLSVHVHVANYHAPHHATTPIE